MLSRQDRCTSSSRLVITGFESLRGKSELKMWGKTDGQRRTEEGETGLVTG